MILKAIILLRNKKVYIIQEKKYVIEDALTCKITLKCRLKFKILQLIQSIVKTNVCERDVEIQMQKVHFRIAEINARACGTYNIFQKCIFKR